MSVGNVDFVRRENEALTHPYLARRSSARRSRFALSQTIRPADRAFAPSNFRRMLTLICGFNNAGSTRLCEPQR
jgi:hypothetical protein